MQGSSMSFAAEGWLLFISCGSVICRRKETLHTMICNLSQSYHPLPTHNGPALWNICPPSHRGSREAGKAMQDVGLSSHYTALGPLAAFQKIQTCSKVRSKRLRSLAPLISNVLVLQNFSRSWSQTRSVFLRWVLSHSCLPPPDVSAEKLSFQMEKGEQMGTSGGAMMVHYLISLFLDVLSLLGPGYDPVVLRARAWL